MAVGYYQTDIPISTIFIPTFEFLITYVKCVISLQSPIKKLVEMRY